MKNWSSKLQDRCIECPNDGEIVRGTCYIIKTENSIISPEKASENCKKDDSFLINVDINNWFSFWNEFQQSFNQFNQEYYVNYLQWN